MVVAEIGESKRHPDGCIVVTTEYRHKDMISQVPGASYDPALPRWVTPLTWSACVALRGVFGDELEVGVNLKVWAANDYATRIGPALKARLLMSLEDNDESLSAEMIRAWRAPDYKRIEMNLYPYQEAGVKFLAAAKRCMLNDEMGTGKTLQLVRTLKLLHELSELGYVESPFPVLIVCPNGPVQRAWTKEFARWWPEIEPWIMSGTAKKRDDKIMSSPVVIVNWEGLRTISRLAPYGSVRLRRCRVCDSELRGQAATLEDRVEYINTQPPDDVAAYLEIPLDDNYDNGKKEALKKTKLALSGLSQSRCEWCPKIMNKRTWATIIGDETHRMKDPKAKQTRAVWACETPGTHYIYTLTGTPLADNPLDLYPSLRLIDSKSWPSRSKYMDRYCNATPNIFGGVTVAGLRLENKEEFFKAVDPRMRRMPKDAVLPFLPKKTYIERYVELGSKQRKAYDQMEAGLIAQLGDSDLVVATNQLTQLTRLVQFASAYAEIVGDNQVRLSEPSCKVDEMMQIIEDLHGDPLVVFAMSRQLIELASARLTRDMIPHGLITGAQTGQERQQHIEAFQGGHTQVILGTVAAGGVGITLTRSPNLCFLQRDWSMINNNQAEDRVHRIGSEIHDKIQIIDVIAENTLESRMRQVLQGKYERLEEFVRDRDFLRMIAGNG